MKVSQTPYNRTLKTGPGAIYARAQYSEFGLASSTGLTLYKYQPSHCNCASKSIKQYLHTRFHQLTTGMASCGSYGKPNVNRADPAASGTYCLPSKANNMGLSRRVGASFSFYFRVDNEKSSLRRCVCV